MARGRARVPRRCDHGPPSLPRVGLVRACQNPPTRIWKLFLLLPSTPDPANVTIGDYTSKWNCFPVADSSGLHYPRRARVRLGRAVVAQQKHGKEVVVRADAAFAKPEIYAALEERGVHYAIRIPANENLERDIAELLPRPVRRPSIRPLVEYKSFLYQAASWKEARRVVAKVEHHQGELSREWASSSRT